MIVSAGSSSSFPLPASSGTASASVSAGCGSSILSSTLSSTAGAGAGSTAALSTGSSTRGVFSTSAAWTSATGAGVVSSSTTEAFSGSSVLTVPFPFRCEPFASSVAMGARDFRFEPFDAPLAVPLLHQSISNWRTKSSRRGKPFFSFWRSASSVLSSRLQAHSSQTSACGPGNSGGVALSETSISSATAASRNARRS